MDSIERHIFNSTPGNKKPIMWFRFIDDIFAILINSVDQLQIFFEHMKNTHPSIQFEVDILRHIFRCIESQLTFWTSHDLVKESS